MKENSVRLKEARRRRYPDETMMDAEYVHDLKASQKSTRASRFSASLPGTGGKIY